ncbi:MAG: 30S ribosomal protein S11 [Candidatus Pacebacteria bacterium]|nr:30S ribosomal protein S11 [Candidatus Paceibacterota bacterium]MCD8507876.1 30S ribosomal protein S11 [Candidatus Paceibacterota bacterium]MCD8527949.1 30S ribosomal protein S11 [Candidatus Paceibacterota bacterium]MCD8563935.1 30S ribosomal protein S11 [Candidatus Paceibacterota bacterium]
MGKKRIVKQKGQKSNNSLKARALARTPKKKLAEGTLYVHATYNNTKVLLTDKKGNAFAASSSGALGFKGAKKGTPFAAAEVGRLVGEKAALMGVTSADVVIKGVGSGRESAVRSFASAGEKGIEINSIVDKTPVPFNGPRPPKPRRV